VSCGAVYYTGAPETTKGRGRQRGNCPFPSSTKFWVARKLLKHIPPFGAEKDDFGEI